MNLSIARHMYIIIEVEVEVEVEVEATSYDKLEVEVLLSNIQ